MKNPIHHLRNLAIYEKLSSFNNQIQETTSTGLHVQLVSLLIIKIIIHLKY